MKKIILSSSALLAMSVGGFAMAMTPTPMQDMKTEMDAIKTAIESNSFSAFQTAAKDTPLSVVDTQTEFDALVALHAKQKAAQEKMSAIHTQLGLPVMQEMRQDDRQEVKNATKDAPKGEKKETAQEAKKEVKSEKDAIHTALEAKDFAAFQTAAKDTPFAVVDTQEKFTTLANAHAEMKALHTEIEAAQTALGLPAMKEAKKEMKSEAKQEMKQAMSEKRSLKSQSLKRADQKAMKKTIETGSFSDFTASTPENHPILDYITEENFPILQELLAAKKAGDSAKVKALIEKLGISKKEANVMKKIIK